MTTDTKTQKQGVPTVKLALFVTHTLPGFFTHSLLALHQALLELGIEVLLFDLSKGLEKKTFSKLIAFDPHFTLSHLFVDRYLGTPLSEILKIPHLTMLLDPPFAYKEAVPGPHLLYSCVDRNDVADLQSAGCSSVFFLPHAIGESDFAKEERERIFDVVYIAFFNDCEKIRASWQKQETKEIAEAIEEACFNVLSNDSTTITGAILESFQRNTLSLKEAGFRKMYEYVFWFTRQKERQELLLSIDDATVHVFGGKYENNTLFSGFPKALSQKSNLILHPPVAINEVPNILSQTKICLNSTPFFKDGSHERVLLSLASGATPLSSKNRYLSEAFALGEEIFLYSFQQRGAVNELISQILSDEVRRKKGALQGKENVKNHHIWKIRSQELIQNLLPIWKALHLN